MDRSIKSSSIIFGGYVYQNLIGLKVLLDWLEDPSLYAWVVFESDKEKDAKGLTGNIGELGKSTTQSLEKLRTAAAWMKYLPSGDKPAKDRAEQRGDTIMKRPDPTFTQGQAMMYYEFSGSPKANDMATQIKKKGEESQRAMEKVHIPLNPAADSERSRPSIEAPRRRASVICLQWPTSVRCG